MPSLSRASGSAGNGAPSAARYRPSLPRLMRTSSVGVTNFIRPNNCEGSLPTRADTEPSDAIATWLFSGMAMGAPPSSSMGRPVALVSVPSTATCRLPPRV